MELYQALITLDGWTFLAQICNLMIQLFIFKKFLLNPVKNVIAERKAKADSQIADATKLRTEAEAMKAEYEQNLQNARAEAGQIVAAAQKTAAARGEELLGEARYRIFDALVEADGFSFIAVGRPEAAGCYCKVNLYLKEVISILADNFDYVVIDGEAGVEQINRRVMEKVTHLLLITDASRKGTQVIQTVKKVADELVMYDQVGAIVNRLPSREVIPLLDTGDIPVLSYIENDAALADFDIRGENVFYLPEEANIVRGVREAVEKLGI